MTESFTIETNEATLAVERLGNAALPTLLFLGGSGTTLDTSRVLLAPLTHHFDLLAFDYRGAGLSTTTALSWTMADYAQDCLAIVDVLGLEQVLILGLSFGGMVALEFAVTHPTRVTRLALWCTSAGGEAGSSYPLELIRRGADDEADSYQRLLLDRRFTDAYLSEHEDARNLALLMARGDAVRPVSEQNYKAQMAARRHHDVSGRLGALTMETFVAMGRFDGIAPLANGEALAARVPTATLRSYDGGHGFFAQDQRAYPDTISFLNEGL
jgi:pimeloyl-ACP methyl ester carboxylesterase